MAAVETLFHRQLTDDRWMDTAACKGLTHLFFPSPAERPQARERREAMAKAVCGSCAVQAHVPRVRPHEPRVRVLGWRERGRAPRGRLPPDRPHRRARPRRRLTHAAYARPHARGRRTSPCRPRCVGRVRRPPRRSCASTRSARTSPPTACTAAPRRRAARWCARCRRTARTSCSSRTTSGSAAARRCSTAPASPACSPTCGRPTAPGIEGAASSPGTTSTCGPCSTTTCPAASRCRGCSPSTRSQNLGREIAEFHLACTDLAPRIPGGSKTIKSDAIHLLDLLESPFAPRNFDLPPESIGMLWRHTHEFLERLIDAGLRRVAEDPGADRLEPRQLLGRHRRRRAFRLFSRWDYDWFRIEPRMLDFYFLSRVSSSTGDRTRFTYGPHTLVEPRSWRSSARTARCSR